MKLGELYRFVWRRSADFDESGALGELTLDHPQLELDSLHAAEARAVACLLQIKPSTVSGAAALMRHVASFEKRGYQWPDGGLIRTVQDGVRHNGYWRALNALLLSLTGLRVCVTRTHRSPKAETGSHNA